MKYLTPPHRLALWIITTVLVSFASVAPARADWPQFRGPAGIGTSESKNPPLTWGPGKNIAWKTLLPGAGTSSPAVFRDRVYIGCYSGFGVPGEAGGNIDDLKRHLVCLNLKDGAILWTTDVTSEAPDKDKIRENHGYASSTPAVDADGVYVFFGRAGVYAFDHAGKKLWRANAGINLSGWGTAASPVIYNNLVIVNASVESESLIAFDKKTGTEVWRARGIKEAWNTPILLAVEGKTELALAIVGKILAFDPASGEQLWSCASGINTYMVPSLSAHEGILYCIGGKTPGAMAVRAGGRGDVTNTHRLWTSRKGSTVSSPVFHEGHLYWMNDNSETAYCADAKTGAIVYEQRINRAGQIYSSPILAAGKVYYLLRGGRTVVIPAKPAFEQLASNDLGERGAFNSSPAMAGNRLLIRSDRFLYCIGE